MPKVTRRGMLAGSAVLGAAAAAPALAGPSTNPAGLELLVSTDGVTVPPKGDGQMKFSFPWPEPSVAFAGLKFGFELVTFDNLYAVDPALVTVTRTSDTLRFVASGLSAAGGQIRVPGRIEAAIVHKAGGAIEWTVSGSCGEGVKAIKTIVRGLPRGRLSRSAHAWNAASDDEQVFEYPTLMGGMATPLMAIETGEGRVWALSSLQKTVRTARFFFWPGPDSYKVELIAEAAGWEPGKAMTSQPWRIGSGATFEEAARPHFAHVQQAWKLPRFSERADAPDWMRGVALVLALHGQHWSGRIFNDYDRQREILRWAAKRVDPATAMVFLAGWDGRYYWDYPAFRPDPRMGGEAGFGRLISEGKKLGFRFALMFGGNVANPASPLYPPLASARLHDLYGNPVSASYVDWDGDRKGDGCMAFMNLAVPAWRDHLASRIDDMLRRFPVDAYFLDICGLWENNPDGDMLEGTRALVTELARRHPHVPPIAEMQYDAQMGFIPMSQVRRYSLLPEANFDHVASFEHLSRAAPGSGSTGVHEYGFSAFKPATVDQLAIPTITFSEGTLADHAALVEREIATARERFKLRGGRT